MSLYRIKEEKNAKRGDKKEELKGLDASERLMAYWVAYFGHAKMNPITKLQSMKFSSLAGSPLLWCSTREGKS